MGSIENIVKSAYFDAAKEVVAVPFEVREGKIRYGLYEIKSGSAFVSTSAKPEEFLVEYPTPLTSDLTHLLPRNTPLFSKLVELRVMPPLESRVGLYMEPRADEVTGQD